jgi:hypothetical protein
MEQIDLFTKRKARKPPPPPEYNTHVMVADDLRLFCKHGWVWFHPANGEYRAVPTANRLKRMGVQPGVSDFVLVSPVGAQVHCLELKRKGAKPTEAQYGFMLAVEACGGVTAWCDSYEEARRILKSWGVLRISLAEDRKPA